MINFKDARILSYSQKNDFLGDIFRYASKKDLTIEGTFYSDDFSGVSSITEQVRNMTASAGDFEPIILNGVNMGEGKINSISYKEGEDVKQKDYVVNVSIYDTGNLFNFNGPNYSGSSLPFVHFVDNVSENFDFSIKDDGTHEYRQNVTVKFVPEAGTGVSGAIVLAKNLASQLLSGTPAFGFISGFYNAPGKRTYSESYNLINNECSFTENYSADSAGTTFSIKYSHEVSTDENGISNVSENGTIKGLTPDYYLNAEQGFNSESSQFFNRCNSVLLHYVPSAGSLINRKLSISKKINKIEGVINYSVSYSNNPNLFNNYFWDYQVEVSKNSENCFYNLRERGKIKGYDGCANVNKYAAAKTGWNTIKPGISARISSMYPLSNPIKLISSSIRESPFNGEVDYDFWYTDDLKYDITPAIKKFDFTVNDNKPVTKTNKFNIVGVKELVQESSILTEGVWSVNVNVQGKRNSTLEDCLQFAKSIASSNKPGGAFSYIESINYNYTPNENNLTLNVSWKYLLKI